MASITRTSLRTKIPLLQEEVWRTEAKLAKTKILPQNSRFIYEHFKKLVFPLPGRREPHYGSTPLQEVVDHLDRITAELGLTASHHFADLGAGLGSACFAAAVHFDLVTGFESNHQIRTEAEAIRQRYQISSVRFRDEDFMTAPLKPYNVLYFFKPFSRDFLNEICNKLLETEPGTVVISRSFMGTELYDKLNFDFLPPLENWMPTPSRPYFPRADFYTFVRK